MGNRRKGGRGKRTINPDSIFWDSSSYRVVCKSWALASFRLLARHLGDNDIDILNAFCCYSYLINFSNFIYF